jgi:hypothetical protein
MDVLRSAEHVDVVDEELDVAGVTQKACDHTDGDADADEDEQVRKGGPVRGPEAVLEEVEQAEVGGADQGSDDARKRDVDEHPPLRPQQALDEQLPRPSKPESACLHKYIVVRAISGSSVDYEHDLP